MKKSKKKFMMHNKNIKLILKKKNKLKLLKTKINIMQKKINRILNKIYIRINCLLMKKFKKIQQKAPSKVFYRQLTNNFKETMLNQQKNLTNHKNNN